MVKTLFMLKNEEGTIMIVALLMLTMLTVIGIAATNTSHTEVRIADNERTYQKAFYAADSGWKDGAMGLDNRAAPPGRANSDPTDQTVRNYGDGSTDTLNQDFPDGTHDNALGDIPYWYKVEYVSNSIVPGCGKEYRKFKYYVTCNANRTQDIRATLNKVYKVGY